MDDALSVRQLFDPCWMVLRCVADLEGNLLRQFRDAFCKEMEVVQREVALVGRLGIVAMAYIKDVLVYVFPYDEPGTASEPEPLALSDGVEPQSPVFADLLPSLEFDDVTGLFTQVTAHILVVVDVAQEADAL